MSSDPGTPAGGGVVPGTPESRTSERLQSMLAQAVEGQQNEQRELTNALTDMRNQLLRLGQEVAELRTARAGASTDPAIINNITVELRESVRFLSERLDGVTRMVAQRGEELADIRSALGAVDAHLRSQTETMGVLSQGLQALPSYGEQVSALHEAVDDVHSRLAALGASVAKAGDNSALVQRLVGVENAVGSLGEHLAHSQQAAADQRASLTELHAKVAEIAEGTRAALAVPPVFEESSIQGIDAKLVALASDVAALSDRDEPSESVPASLQAAVQDAVEESEERLRSHIDDAVLALAEILVRRRPPATADQITGTPLSTMTSTPPAPVGIAPLELPADDDEDDETPMVDFSVAEFADEDADETSAEADEDDEYDDEYDEEDDENEYEDDEYDEEDPDEGDVDEPDDPDATGEFRFPSAFDDLSPLEPAPTETQSAPPRAPWSPEVPPERAEPEASEPTIVPEERKRRWFSR